MVRGGSRPGLCPIRSILAEVWRWLGHNAVQCAPKVSIDNDLAHKHAEDVRHDRRRLAIAHGDKSPLRYRARRGECSARHEAGRRLRGELGAVLVHHVRPRHHAEAQHRRPRRRGQRVVAHDRLPEFDGLRAVGRTRPRHVENLGRLLRQLLVLAVANGRERIVPAHAKVAVHVVRQPLAEGESLDGRAAALDRPVDVVDLLVPLANDLLHLGAVRVDLRHVVKVALNVKVVQLRAALRHKGNAAERRCAGRKHAAGRRHVEDVRREWVREDPSERDGVLLAVVRHKHQPTHARVERHVPELDPLLRQVHRLAPVRDALRRGHAPRHEQCARLVLLGVEAGARKGHDRRLPATTRTGTSTEYVRASSGRKIQGTTAVSPGLRDPPEHAHSNIGKLWLSARTRSRLPRSSSKSSGLVPALCSSND
eukprot:Opistho-1_new@13536